MRGFFDLEFPPVVIGVMTVDEGERSGEFFVNGKRDECTQRSVVGTLTNRTALKIQV